MKPLPPWHCSASGRRRGHARQQALVFVRFEVVGRPGHAQRHQGGGLDLDRHVGQHVGHHRLLGDRRAEGAARARVPQGQRQRLPHQPRGPDGEIESRQVRMGEDLADAAALLADADGERAVELDLARRVRPVAGLVLQPLQEEAVVAAVGQGARQEEAGHPAVDLGQSEETVGLRHRAEPLVPGQFVPVRDVAVIVGGVRPAGGGLRLAQVRAALLLGHRVADHDRRLVRDFAPTEFVGGALDLLGPDGQAGLGDETGVGGVGHAGRAARALLDLVPQVRQHGAGVMRLRLACTPRQVRHFVPPRQRHQFVPARVELDPVDPVAETVVGLQFRRVAVGQPRQFLHVLFAGQRADRGAASGRPRRLAGDGGGEHRVVAERVETDRGLRLVEDDVRGGAAVLRIGEGGVGDRVHGFPGAADGWRPA